MSENLIRDIVSKPDIGIIECKCSSETLELVKKHLQTPLSVFQTGDGFHVFIFTRATYGDPKLQKWYPNHADTLRELENLNRQAIVANPTNVTILKEHNWPDMVWFSAPQSVLDDIKSKTRHKESPDQSGDIPGAYYISDLDFDPRKSMAELKAFLLSYNKPAKPATAVPPTPLPRAQSIENAILVKHDLRHQRVIYFFAKPEVARLCEQFGKVWAETSNSEANFWCVQVSELVDFDGLVAWMKAYPNVELPTPLPKPEPSLTLVELQKIADELHTQANNKFSGFTLRIAFKVGIENFMQRASKTLKAKE